MADQITFTRVPILGMIGCGVPVIPGTPTIDVSIEQRTELCAVDVDWIVGLMPTCDHHVKTICQMAEIDWPDLVAEAGRDLADAERPWGERLRHSQEVARDGVAHFIRGES